MDQNSIPKPRKNAFLLKWTAKIFWLLSYNVCRFCSNYTKARMQFPDQILSHCCLCLTPLSVSEWLSSLVIYIIVKDYHTSEWVRAKEQNTHRSLFGVIQLPGYDSNLFKTKKSKTNKYPLPPKKPNPVPARTWEAEAGTSLWVEGHPDLHSDFQAT